MNGHHKKYYREGAAMLVQFKTVTGPFNDSVGKHLYCNTNIHTKYFTFKITDKENPLWPVLYAVDTEKNIIGENLRERKACGILRNILGAGFFTATLWPLWRCRQQLHLFSSQISLACNSVNRRLKSIASAGANNPVCQSNLVCSVTSHLIRPSSVRNLVKTCWKQGD